MRPIFESHIEEFIIELLQGQGFSYLAPEQKEALDEPAGGLPVRTGNGRKFDCLA
jgi:hypothetical protein